MAAAAVILFATALSAAGGTRATYVVAGRPLVAGSVIGPGDLRTAQLGLSGPTAGAAWRDPGALVGRTLRIGLAPGELIQAPMLAGGPGSDLRPVSIAVDSDSLAAVSAGQPVDVLKTGSGSGSGSGDASSGGASAEGPAVTVVVRGAVLWSVGHRDNGLLSGGDNGTTVVTLGVSDLGQVEALIAAAHSGTVELAQAEPADGTGSGPGSASS